MRMLRKIFTICLLGVSVYFPLNAQQLHIGLCVMATGRYIGFVRQLLDSAEKYFCPQYKRTYFIFTDAKESSCSEIRSSLDSLLQAPYVENIVITYQKRLGWPYDTLMRFVVYHEHKDLFSETDYMFATDADMLFVGFEGDEILGDRVATQHPGFEGKKPLWGDVTPYDRNPLSTAYIPYDEGEYYFAGGFYGGLTEEFIKMSSRITHNVFSDLEQLDYVAVWHDESHLNRYFITYKPTVMLDRSYCYPENGQKKGYPDCCPKLLALDKNHDEMRE